jgi:putative hydrolase of the HAD superfamily
MRKFKYIGFDADDTLWVNEPCFREKEEQFCQLLKDYGDMEFLTKELLKTELHNIKRYGYGIKGFILSMIETGIRVTNGNISPSIINKIIELGKEMLDKPEELLDGVDQVLNELCEAGYKLIVATKGDLLDQERKLRKSNLEKYFHHIEIMSDKKEGNYKKLLGHLDIKPEEFLMVGNSLKSDIVPVLKIGGFGVHIPYHTTWIHEHIEDISGLKHFWEIEKISQIHDVLQL